MRRKNRIRTEPFTDLLFNTLLGFTFLFFILAIGGLAFQFGFQSLIHMASNTDLIPTKGMTLPFLSYGGSSLLASAITAGIILSLTKRSNPLDPFRKEIYEKK